MNTDAIQPHSDEGEEALLGCLLLDGHFPEGARQWGKVAWLKSRMFTQKRHALIFEAIEGVVAQGLAVDVLTVGREVDKRGTWDEVGGGGYLFLLTNRVPTPLHAVHYASIVKDCWERREKIWRGTRMVQEAVTSTDTMERYAKETPPWKV